MDYGMAFAVVALVCWGFGDFLIQRSARKLGTWETLFFITLFGAVALTPFVYGEMGSLATLPAEFWLLLGCSVMILFAALVNFEALKRGKLAIVEPVLAMEVPFSIILAFFILGEVLTMAQGALVLFILLGLLLVSLKTAKLSRRQLEKGALLGLGGAAIMGSANFLVGYSSRMTSPLMINWFMNVFMAAICAIYLLHSRRRVFRHFLKERRMLLSVSVLNNAAWVAFAFAATMAPIGIVVAISESYVALAVLLGLVINKERIHAHQKVGLVLALAGVIVLASL